ncbi:hypothetical protein GETHLI_18360 [Geothrix limicola]|uniref:NarG-like domain-containing protein n=1 Tax=Geothrix limicola TaxID=2927978 RepID=A0ABQ5QH17_9BACT|nr:hypothetical protein [Geothrix limicola]GLH73334.1 hypothetical protein GETHLI_18360 [Geothrix limicola]
MSVVLTLGVLASATWAVAGLVLLRAEARAYGSRALHAAPAGDPAAGVRYAFTGAMSPGAKESVREHLPSYFAGLAYHGGIFTALGLLLLALCDVALPGRILMGARILLGLGVLGGLGLLLKRLLKPELRRLSHPDDVVSNLLATAFVALALTGPVTAWMLSAMLLLIYVPLGKIRHCLFFFVARRHLGAFFGRRGVFPPGGAHVR